MARKPARLERAGALTPRDRMWAAIRALSASSSADPAAGLTRFSAVEVLFLANLGAPEPLHVTSVHSYLTGLSKAQPPYVRLVDGDRPAGRRRTELALWRLVRDVGVDTPNVNAEGKATDPAWANTQMWIAMKGLKTFDKTELALAASTTERQVLPGNASTYLKHLVQAGYVVVDVPSVPGRQARFRFVRAMNTGPRPPLVTRKKEVIDGNTGRVVWPKAGA